MMNHVRFGTITAAVMTGMCLLLIGACGKKDRIVDPKDRTTLEMTEEERDYAIKNLKETDIIPIDSLMEPNLVKMSVLPPAPTDLITEEYSERIAAKMLRTLTANGIGGVNNVPGFAFASKWILDEQKATGTAPQRQIVRYSVEYSVVNLTTGDVYATAVQTVEGVGETFQEATGNAVKQFAPSGEVKGMLKVASERIVKWFDDNLDVFKGQVVEAEGHNDYALALALVQSVPAQSKAAFDYARTRMPEIEKNLRNSVAASEFIAMREAVAKADSKPSSEVYAHYGMIPIQASCYKEATALLNKYEKDVERQWAKDKDLARADLEAERQNQMELAKLENTRIIAKYEAQATEQAIRNAIRQNDNMRRGFWGNLGARIIGAIDGTNSEYRMSSKPYTEDK